MRSRVLSTPCSNCLLSHVSFSRFCTSRCTTAIAQITFLFDAALIANSGANDQLARIQLVIGRSRGNL
jgi:hypothetical protein